MLIGLPGPSLTIIIANMVVALGAVIQAGSHGADGFALLALGRFIIGFGGLITPFCTIEVLARLFPDDFMFMAGFRNLIQSASGFGAFVVLRRVVDSEQPGRFQELGGCAATVAKGGSTGVLSYDCCCAAASKDAWTRDTVVIITAWKIKKRVEYVKDVPV